MNETPGEWATRLRNATSDSARVLARRGLAVAIGRLVEQTLAGRGVPADVAEDEASFLAYDLVRRVEAGRIQPGREDAYVRQCARHRAIDHYREVSGVRAVHELRDDAEELADSRDPERLLAEHQEAAIRAARLERMRALIASAPVAHAAVLHEVHVKGTLIEDIARRELDARIARGAEHVPDRAARKRARAAVDQRLCRARSWIREQMTIDPTPEPSVRAGGDGSDSLVVVYSREATLLHSRFVLHGADLRVGRGADNEIVLAGDSASRHHARFERRSNAWWVVDAGSTNGTFVNDEQAWSARRLGNGDRVKVGTTIFEYVGGPDLESQYLEVITEIRDIDPLTQARTKRCLFTLLETEVLRAKSQASALSLLLIGIDHFEKLDDFHGDSAGTVVLKELARLVQQRAQDGEHLARHDSDELALLLPETSLEGACGRAGRLREDIAHASFLFQGDALNVTVSIGVAALTGGSGTPATLVRAARDRLSDAQCGGGNRVAPPGVVACASTVTRGSKATRLRTAE